MKLFLITTLSFSLFMACSSNPIIETEKVKVSRDEPGAHCKFIADVQGSVISAKGSSEEALQDMKKEAALKGANFVQIKSFGALGTSVQGASYWCN